MSFLSYCAGSLVFTLEQVLATDERARVVDENDVPRLVENEVTGVAIVVENQVVEHLHA